MSLMSDDISSNEEKLKVSKQLTETASTVTIISLKNTLLEQAKKLKDEYELFLTNIESKKDIEVKKIKDEIDFYNAVLTEEAAKTDDLNHQIHAVFIKIQDTKIIISRLNNELASLVAPAVQTSFLPPVVVTECKKVYDPSNPDLYGRLVNYGEGKKIYASGPIYNILSGHVYDVKKYQSAILISKANREKVFICSVFAHSGHFKCKIHSKCNYVCVVERHTDHTKPDAFTFININQFKPEDIHENYAVGFISKFNTIRTVNFIELMK